MKQYTKVITLVEIRDIQNLMIKNKADENLTEYDILFVGMEYGILIENKVIDIRLILLLAYASLEYIFLRK